MSSIVFEVEVRPDPTLRWLVLLSGTAALCVGVWLISNLPVALPWRLTLGLCWLWDCARELLAQHRGARRTGLLRLDCAGNVKVVDPEGRSEAAMLMTGSIVLQRVAWLRIGRADGGRHGELLTAVRSGASAWHRFRLLWRQCANTFGHNGRA